MGRWALDVAFVWRAVLTLGLVLLYYCFSIGITFYNKWLTKSFHFPLFMTMLHLAVIFLFSALSRALVQCSSHRARVVLSWTDYLRRVAPTALATALDVGLSNWSFLYITVSLYTMTKSSAVLFILIFSLIFKLEELRAALVLVVLLIAGGLFMFTYKSTQFNAEGFALVLGASFIGGIRWTLTQMLLQKAELGLQNPIDTMFHLQPLMFLGLFPLFAVFEGLHLSTSEKIFRFQDTGLLLRVLGSLFLGGILAFGLGFSEFLLVSRTSSLTLSIAGIFKGHGPGRHLKPEEYRVPRGSCQANDEAEAVLLRMNHLTGPVCGSLHFALGSSSAGRSDQSLELAGLRPLPLGNIPAHRPQSPAFQR
ncbi:solute carrier family 35 member C2 isoform X2 [Eschrichtius robustus]|uniref:solute carrier family 35 member C2 isoform X2 n=1 Tax=Eschrichtius robustus TaxID=9764 RepID=UPI0035BF9DF0